jgi:hypothetical protein
MGQKNSPGFSSKNWELFFPLIHMEFAIEYFCFTYFCYQDVNTRHKKHKYYSHPLENIQHQTLVMGMVKHIKFIPWFLQHQFFYYCKFFQIIIPWFVFLGVMLICTWKQTQENGSSEPSSCHSFVL